MEIPCNILVWTGQILALWMPIVLSGCLQDMQGMSLGSKQSFVPLKNDMDKSCKALSDGDTEECSNECDEKVRDILDLFATYFSCDCSDLSNQFYTEDECIVAQERLGVCPTLRYFLTETTPQTSTTPTILENGKIPCERARQHCLEDNDCKVRLETTINTCDTGCHEDCKHTVDALLALRQAQSLWECTGCSDGTDDNWCNWSKRCSGTLETYKPGGEQSSTDKTTGKGTQGGSARKSVDPGNNGAGPRSALFVSSVGLYLFICVSSSIIFV